MVAIISFVILALTPGFALGGAVHWLGGPDWLSASAVVLGWVFTPFVAPQSVLDSILE